MQFRVPISMNFLVGFFILGFLFLYLFFHIFSQCKRFVFFLLNLIIGSVCCTCFEFGFRVIMGSAPFPVGFVTLVTSADGKFRVVLPNKTLGLCNFSIRV